MPETLCLSPLEERIAGALAGRDWTPARVIADEVGEDPEGDIRAVLRNLAERQILDGCPKGFRLVCGDERGKPSRPRKDDTSDVIARLVAMAQGGAEVSLTLAFGGVRLVLKSDGLPGTPGGLRRAVEGRGKEFSYNEEKILAELSHGEWRSSRDIVAALGLSDENRVKAILTNLVDRDLLLAAPGKGYRLPPPDEDED